MCHGFDSASPYQVQYKRGHDERVSTFTPVADTPELLRARAGGQLQNDVRNGVEGRGNRSVGKGITHTHQAQSPDPLRPYRIQTSVPPRLQSQCSEGRDRSSWDKLAS